MSIKGFLALAEIFLALAVWGLALMGVLTGQALVLRWLYYFAWYPLVLCLDGLLFRLKGESWLLSRPRELGRMAFWSVTGWLVFEALNLVLENWGYLGVLDPWWLRWPGYALAFATVFPGVLLTAELLAALGLGQGLRGRPRDPGAWQPFSLVLGTVMLVLTLAFPHYAFPLIWLAFIFLLDPFCELLGAPSLLGRLAAGERQEHLCLLTAGLLCGLWWELWNWPATAKWVYTLPVFRFWKVFEMPLLGYLGFPPFALECAVMYSFFKAMETRLSPHPRRRRLSYIAHVVFWLLMFAALDTWTVISYH